MRLKKQCHPKSYFMTKNSITIFSTLALLLFLATGFTTTGKTEVKSNSNGFKALDTLETVKAETPKEDVSEENDIKLYKSNVLATYYADKFNGRKTTSGERFHNNKYTAAHMRLPLGTMLRVTNVSNGKSVDVKVNDRGPFSKKLEIDLTKKAFMEIASNKGSGSFKVKLEIIKDQK